MSHQIQCSQCRGTGRTWLPSHLFSVLQELRKQGPSTATHMLSRFPRAGIGATAMCNRLAKLFSYGFVTRERHGKEWIYSTTVERTKVAPPMKVLRPGRDQKGWSCEATCTGKGNGGGGCGAKLLVEQADIYLTHSSHYDGSNETYATFRCSECKVETDLPESKVPSSVLDAAPAKEPRR